MNSRVQMVLSLSKTIYSKIATFTRNVSVRPAKFIARLLLPTANIVIAVF